MIKIIQNVDIMSELEMYDVTLIPAHINNSLSNGVQRDIALNYPHVQKANYATKYGDPKKMGTILECSEDNEPTIVLVYIFKFYPHKKTKGEIIDFCSYESLEKCLQLVNARYKGQRICSPLLGCSRFDGNGDREKVLSLMEKHCTDIELTVYDYHQLSRNEKQIKMFKEEAKVKETDREAYYAMVKKRKEEAEQRFRRNGHARY